MTKLDSIDGARASERRHRQRQGPFRRWTTSWNTVLVLAAG
ncbi:MAG: hypothetical protein U0165_11655 [Polyangiaceae bacterium]